MNHDISLNEAFNQLLTITQNTLASNNPIDNNMIELIIRITEELRLDIQGGIQNIPNDDIPVYSIFINRCITMFEEIMSSNNNLTDQQKNRFRVLIENLRSTSILLESHQNQVGNLPQQGGKKITRNKKSRKGKKSRRKNRKSRRKYRKI